MLVTFCFNAACPNFSVPTFLGLFLLLNIQPLDNKFYTQRKANFVIGLQIE